MTKKGFFVTGTGTGVGKTLVSLGLCLHFKADYWKPVQTGQPSDVSFIQKFLPKSQIHRSSESFKAPLSPNQSAEEEGRKIDLKNIIVPKSSFLIVEGIGGVYVPLNKKENLMDLMQKISLPLIVVAHSGIGTLNHSLLTLSVLQKRQLEVAGVILSGPKNKKNKRDIEHYGQVPVILEVPPLPQITKAKLKALFSRL